MIKNPSLALAAHGIDHQLSLGDKLPEVQIPAALPIPTYSTPRSPRPKKAFGKILHLKQSPPLGKRATSRGFKCLVPLAFKFEFYLIYGRRRRRRRWRRWWLAETFNTANLSQNIHLQTKRALSKWRKRERTKAFKQKQQFRAGLTSPENSSMLLIHKHYVQKQSPGCVGVGYCQGVFWRLLGAHGGVTEVPKIIISSTEGMEQTSCKPHSQWKKLHRKHKAKLFKLLRCWTRVLKATRHMRWAKPPGWHDEARGHSESKQAQVRAGAARPCT